MTYRKCSIFFFFCHRNLRRPFVSSIEMTITVYMARMPIWRPNRYSSQRQRWKPCHRRANRRSITFAWVKAISKFFSANCCWLKTTASKSIRRKAKRMIGPWSSKDRPATWSSLRTCYSTILKWWSDPQSCRSIWNKMDNKRYSKLYLLMEMHKILTNLVLLNSPWELRV